MNYVTEITVIRNSRLKFISMILLDFQIFNLVQKSTAQFYVHSGFKCPFIRFSVKKCALVMRLG